MAGQTLWERLTAKPEEPEEFKHYNPLKAKIGSSVDLDSPDYGPNGEAMFFVKEIRETTRTINGDKHQFCDYTLLARPAGSDEDITVRLRLSPLEKPVGDQTHQILLLNPYDEMQFDQGFLDLVTSTEQFHVDDDDNKESADYWRPSLGQERLKTTWNADTVTVKEVANTDTGKTAVGALTGNMDYWDFSRICKDTAEQDYEQFLFVEMDKDNGMFTIWRGQGIDPHRVVLI